MTTTPTRCDCCQQISLHTFTQTALVAGRPDRQYYECRNAECPMLMQTLTLAQYLERCAECKAKA